jgi:hypothetical protein
MVSTKQKCSWENKRFGHNAMNFRWVISNFLLSLDANEFQVTEAYSSLCVVKVKPTVNKESSVEDKYVILLIT